MVVMKFFVLMLSVFLLMFSFTVASDDTNSTLETYNLINSKNLTKPGCNSTCGDLVVPYPFGIGSNCSINEGFDLHCETSLNSRWATVFSGSSTSIKKISDSNLRVSNVVARRCYFPNGKISSLSGFEGGFSDTKPYTFSQLNKFTVIGCDDYARLTPASKWVQYISYGGGCMAFCPNLDDDVVPDDCSGIGCCQSSIPKDVITDYIIELFTMLNSSGIMNSSQTRDNRSLNHCTYAFVGEANAFKFNGATDLNDTNFANRIEDTVPRVFEWAIGNTSCAKAKVTRDYACQLNSECVDSSRKTGGYRCVCKKGYEGNPYLYGCQDIDECKDMKKFPCYGSTCVNTPGNYTCKCKEGYSGDGKLQDGCKRKPFNVLRLTLGMGLGFITLLTGLSILHFIIQKRKLIKLREKFFHQNGGVLLEDKLKTTSGSGFGFMKIFRVEELEEATNKYSKDRILGRGGNGTVYKGVLPDKRVVAIKKSQRLDEGQRGQFINEMIILAQLNHPNVVQLLGCCLEIDVPLLVYEFVSNDTLYHHIHNRTSGSGRLSWDSRLRVAQESAGALSYLHRDTRMCIIHRDVKSTNILLDDTYTAKIADFGASRLVPLGHDQVTTLVQGTLGYLDPEYFHTGQLTDKSDVYSFGVVLAELLTSKKPLGIERDLEDRTLATYFVKARKENRLSEILDRQMVQEATDEQLKEACDLVCRCLNQVGGNRPSMKEVTMELKALRKKGKQHPWNGISQGTSTETSSFMIDSEERDLYSIPLVSNASTFSEFNPSITELNEMMLEVQNPR